MKKLVTTVLSRLLLAGLLAGCAHGAKLDTPKGFANLGKSGDAFSYRAASAKGVVLTTRTEDNDVEANTEFWAEALDAKLRARGYAAEPSRTVKTARGLEGTQLRYLATLNGREHRYWVTVFTTASKVYVVEAAGDKEPFDQQLAVVENAIGTLDASN
jgi:hypothetical protein